MNVNQATEEILGPAIPQGPEAKRQFWANEIKRWRDSGQSQRRYSKSRGLMDGQLNYWKKKFELNTETKPLPSSSFTPIHVKAAFPTACIRIKRPNGTCIELPILPDMDQLKALVKALGC